MSHERLGEFEFAVLATLLRHGGEAYGAQVRQSIEELLERSVSIGAVYATLVRLETKGYVRSRRGEPTPERGGKSKRFFQVLASGRSALRRSMEERRRLVEGLDLGAPA